MATGIGASVAPSPVRAACSDRRPSLPWTSPNQPDEDTTAGQGLGRSGAAELRKTRFRLRAEQSGPPQTKGRPEGRPFRKKLVSSVALVRRFVGRLIRRVLVGGGRRGQADLCAVQESGGHLSGLVSLAGPRHDGLRDGPFLEPAL